MTKDSSGDVFGEIDENGSWSTGGGDLEGFVDSTGEFRDVLDHDVPFGAGARDSDNVGFLEGVGTDGGGGD